ncbi:hypothetical protein J2853_008246 [Streptosporangium lutulentum]|uniref:Uncharacterized protein n=1 Tax=Streptosporangium lutulentum TaxID=1461250 RepID=A0ABT9QRH9_9ACTN|nr:hypothetical protein [Streptosporangium lutulentum]
MDIVEEFLDRQVSGPADPVLAGSGMLTGQ